ncbi:MAG: RluA family pseudouridine synthase [Candidatus Kapabacteria bacterium]|nr:RluA family pseudouridine synthase [Candidatus Kapabacteria bacterium]MCS7169263.1 RluA family pseudouridine synthase [Candidatus Kapabacteria bacterium]MDW7997514.1 RluA family pseudouridine synthase [Bacteroidota bacterium]MDW8225785.1 RluA family pseudouridine synthase [Bacteroidota bacterium]
MPVTAAVEERDERVPFTYEFRVPEGQRPERIDLWLAHLLPHASRTKVQRSIEAGCIRVNGRVPKSSYRVRPGDYITCTVYRLPPIELVPEPLSLEIAYEDEYLMVLNKPAGTPTHPGLGHRRGTVVNAVLYHLGLREPVRVEAELDGEEDEGAIFASDAVRPGIVHRLDKDTSGLLLVTKDSALHARLAEQFARRQIQREYWAIVWGQMPEQHGIVDAPIGRSPHNRKAFAVLPSGKPARTEYWVLEEYPVASLIRLRLHTGRTHQIRVHCAWLGHPVLGDVVYGGSSMRVTPPNPLWRRCAQRCLELLTRQALHARTLGFFHPISHRWIECEAPLPADMEAVWMELRATAQELGLQSLEDLPQSALPGGVFRPAVRCR